MRNIKCRRCGCSIEGKHWNSKYCKDCARTKHLMQMRHWYSKYKELGTTNFKSYRCKDFNKEQIDIKREYTKLGLKKDKLYK